MSEAGTSWIIVGQPGRFFCPGLQIAENGSDYVSFTLGPKVVLCTYLEP